MSSTADSAPRVALHDIVRTYGTVRANDGVSLSVMPGEIHGLIGENGAGKSTLMKVLYGLVQPDSGRIEWDGAPVRLHSPADARALGIGMVFQHFALFDTLTVAENVALGQSTPAAVRRDLAGHIRELGHRYGLPVDPDRHVYTLSIGERQRVEIIRALLQSPRLLILDEPTSVLAPAAVGPLFDTLRLLASEGVSILYISHRLDEVRALCHRATVMRAGRVSGQCDPRTEPVAALSRMMLGGEPPRVERARARIGARALRLAPVSLEPLARGGQALHDCALDLHAGEIVGLAGVSGNGQGELLAVLSGEDRRAPADAVLLGERPVGRLGVRARRALGLGFLPEERLGRATVPSFGLDQNLLLTLPDGELRAGPLLRRGAAVRLAAGVIERFRVRAAGPHAPAASLSGGNLQKFLMGRELRLQPSVLIVAQPTWGVDVGAAAQIHQELVQARDRGAAVLVVSESLDELFLLADTIVVMHGGRLSAPMPAAEAGVERLGALMGGVHA